MKNNKIQFLSTLIGISLLWVGCQKGVVEPTVENQKAVYQKTMGADPIDESQMSTVPLIMSTDFSTKESNSATNLSERGKPVKPPTGGGGGDVTVPSVSITSPANGTSFASTTTSVTINANASDNVGVSSVSFSVDGAVIGTDNIAPYSITWNIGAAAAGNHSITVTARDAANNGASASISVAKQTAIIILPPPPSIPTSHSLVMPPVIQQGSEGSCISVAVSYQRSYEAYKRSGATSYSQSTNILSPEYLFNQVKTSTTCSGSALLTNLNFVRDNGICTWAVMPYTWANGCTTMPTSTQTQNAANYRIASYSQIYASDITAIKTMIASNRPVVSQYTVDNQFYSAGPGFIWKSFSGAIGSHGLVICGYDDAKQAFKVINQWGTTWGDAGYSWIDYNFLKSVSSNLFVMNL